MISRKPKIYIARIAYVFLAIVAIAYGFGAYYTFNSKSQPSSDLAASRFIKILSCSDGGVVLPGFELLCREYLLNIKLSKEEVHRINQMGELSTLSILPRDFVEKLLPNLVHQGVDVNSSAPGLHGNKARTQLHLSTGGPTWWVQLLLENGARTDLRDSDGLTPVDWSRKIQTQNPGNAETASILELLESHKNAVNQ